MSELDEICSNANKNPVCPYITDIHRQKSTLENHTKSLNVIEKALIGDDLQGGMVKRLSDVEAELKEVKSAVKRRWNLKDTGTFLLGLAAFVTALWALWPK